MHTYLDCIPCFFRQALETTRRAGLSEDEQRQVMIEFGRRLPEFSLRSSPPEIAHLVYSDIMERVGRDPFKEIRESSNREALELFSGLKRRVEGSSDPLWTAVRLAIAGNVIDYGTPGSFNIKDEIENVLETGFGVFMFNEFLDSLDRANSLLYLCDNAGEIIFDRLLIEEIKKHSSPKITAAVRGAPVLNDAVIEDADQAGLNRICRVISNGSKFPGTLIDHCSEEFQLIYREADLIISKGQGNFETLWGKGENIFFLFKVKCNVVARHINGNVGDTVLLSNIKHSSGV